MSSSDQKLSLCYELAGEHKAVEVDAPVTFVGRDLACEIALPKDSRGVSRRHAKIERDASGWMVFDLKSRNGTLVNGAPVTAARLNDGDRITLGVVDMLVVMTSPQDRLLQAKVTLEDEDKAVVVNTIDMRNFANKFGMFGAAQSDLTRMTPDGVPGLAAAGRISVVSLFSQAGEALLSSDSLDDMLVRIMDLLYSILPCERGSICLYDEASDDVSVKLTRTLDGRPDEEIKISQSIVREVLKAKNSVLVHDSGRDVRFSDAASIRNMNICSAMCAPLYHEDQVRGFIYLDSQQKDRLFVEQDLEILAAMSVFSAVGVQQTQLRESVANEKRIRERLSRYSSPAVVDQIVRAGGDANMAPKQMEVSVLFADLSGFTAMSESMRPAEVADVLNELFDRLTSAVFEHAGTIDKYIGDALMAIFGAPLDQQDHAERAVRTALSMFEKLDDYNARYPQRPKIDMRIGINSGPVVAGDIGSPKRREYTVIGDTVNVASRLESSVAKPRQIVIGPNTHEHVKLLFTCKPLDQVQLKGKTLTIQPYCIVPTKHDISEVTI